MSRSITGRINRQQMYRYTLRIDGFISRRADFEKRLLVTKAFTFEGSKLSVNFSTSAIGYIRIIIEDIYGNPIDGYTGYELLETVRTVM